MKTTLIRAAAAATSLTALLASCGDTVTRVSYVETDTFISSADPAGHAELSYLRISNTGGIEERAILKLPTGETDPNQRAEDTFEELGSNPLLWPLAPFLILLSTFEDMFDCHGRGASLTSSNLISSHLILDVNSNPGGADLTQIRLELLSKPWWQTANWTQAFPFSSAGVWASGGGDIDSSFAAIPATIDGSTIQFDIENYFKTILDNTNQPHYGFVLRSAGGAAMSQVVLDSVQFGNSSQRPRLVSVYSCPAATTTTLRAGNAPQAAELKTTTYILGPRE